MHIEEYLQAYISQDNNETDLSVIYSRPMRARGYRQRRVFSYQTGIKHLPAGDLLLRPDLRATDSCRASLDSAVQKVANSLIRTMVSSLPIPRENRRTSTGLLLPFVLSAVQWRPAASAHYTPPDISPLVREHVRALERCCSRSNPEENICP
jgi:hypothetical protein